MSLLLMVVTLVTLALTLANNHGSLRFSFGVVLGLFVPGWTIVGFLHLDNAALEFSLSVGASLALLMVAAQVLITLNAWHLGGLESFTCVVCAPILFWQSRRVWRSTIV